MRNKVSDLQSKLYHAAKQSLDRKFGAGSTANIPEAEVQ
jgi:hypothetical protein